MGSGSGQFSHLGIGKESVWGTPVAVTDYLKITSHSLTPSIEELVSAALSGKRDEPESYEGGKSLAGDIVMECRPEAIGHLLNSWFSNVSSVQQGATSAYLHEFTPLAGYFNEYCWNQPYTLEAFMDIGDAKALQVAGAAVNVLNFSFGSGEKILGLTASIIAKDHAFISKTTPSFENTEPFRWNQAEIEIGGVANGHLESLAMSLDAGLVGVPLLNNSKAIGKLVGDSFRMGSITPTFVVQDTDEFEKFIGWTTAAWVITFTGPVADGAYNYLLKFTFPKVLYTAFPLATPGPGRMTVGASAKIKYDSVSGYMCKIELQNTKTSY